MNKAQQEFDAVVAHLYKQGRPAKRDDSTKDMCAYRGDNGLMCAVGCRIPDKLYRPCWEGMSVTSLEGLPEDIENNLYLFVDLQLAHDHCDTKSDGTFNKNRLRSDLSAVAKKHGLTFKVLK